MDLQRELGLALDLADAADAVTVPRFRAADLKVETKPDTTPVTEADRAAEEIIRSRLTAARPDHGIVGEEYGDDGRSGPRWIIDPIDATMNYVRGIPIWATLLALEVDGEMAVGVVSAPPIGHRWWAARGLGAFRNGEPIEVSIRPTDVWQFPVVWDGTPRTLLTIDRMPGGWQAVDLGGLSPAGSASGLTSTHRRNGTPAWSALTGTAA